MPAAAWLAAFAAAALLAAAGPEPARSAPTPGPAATPAASADDVPRVLEPPPGVREPTVRATGAALWDPVDERLLLGHEAERARPMASLTKMLTALLLVEEADDLDGTVTVSPAAAGVGGASVGLQAGQEVPLRSLVAGLMVESGNDAAVAAAEHVAGSEAAFVEMMHARARELGAGSARFVNASGLTDDPAHRASPVDLARLGSAAMAEPLVARFAGADAVIVDGLPPLVNRNELLGSYPGADGIKTGHTAAAGFSLAGSATREGWRLIAVVLDSDERGADAAALLDWGFSTFDRARAAAAGDVLGAWRRRGEVTALTAEGALAATVPTDAAARLRLRVAPHVAGRVAAGSALGRAELVVDGTVVGTTPLRAADPVAGGAEAEPPADEEEAAARVGGALADALRGLARAAPVDAAVPRQDGRVTPSRD